jgi:hypothetical protein
VAARLNLRQQAQSRAAIQTTQLLKRLQDHVNGKVDLKMSQIRAAEVLLRKTIPDLAAVQLNVNHEQRPVRELEPHELKLIAGGLSAPEGVVLDGESERVA